MKTIATYRHRDDLPQQQPDPQPGDYFVTAHDAGRTALLSGPYGSHSVALDEVDDCRAVAESLDPWAVFYAFGTVRLPVGSGRVGLLQVLKILP